DVVPSERGEKAGESRLVVVGGNDDGDILCRRKGVGARVRDTGIEQTPGDDRCSGVDDPKVVVLDHGGCGGGQLEHAGGRSPDQDPSPGEAPDPGVDAHPESVGESGHASLDRPRRRGLTHRSLPSAPGSQRATCTFACSTRRANSSAPYSAVAPVGSRRTPFADTETIPASRSRG